MIVNGGIVGKFLQGLLEEGYGTVKNPFLIIDPSQTGVSGINRLLVCNILI